MYEILKWLPGLCLMLPCSGCARQPRTPAAVAATNSYLECVVKDLLEQDISVFRLAEPGMCPGHFDLRPGQIAQLRDCRVLFRFDFQQSIDDKLADAISGGLRISEVRVKGGMCEPASYLSACRQVGEVLNTTGLSDNGRVAARLAAIEKRLGELGTWVCERMDRSGHAGQPVVTSRHQAAFCEWLGLRIAATFSSTDVTRIGEINDTVRAGVGSSVTTVVANLPEGRQLADALAERLRARVVVFGNFPIVKDGRTSFDDLVRGNVKALLEGDRR